MLFLGLGKAISKLHSSLQPVHTTIWRRRSWCHFATSQVCCFRQLHGLPVPWDSPESKPLLQTKHSCAVFQRRGQSYWRSTLKMYFTWSLKGSRNHLKLLLWTWLDVAQCNSSACFDVQQDHYNFKAAIPQTIFRWNFNYKFFRLTTLTSNKHGTSVKSSLSSWFRSIGG